MNGFTMMADSFRQILKQHPEHESREYFESEIKVNDFLGTCTKDEICMLFNSSAFNEIAKAYFRTAMKNQNMDEEKIEDVMNEFRFLLDERTAKEILNHE